MFSALLLMFSRSQTLSMKSGLICLSILFPVGISFAPVSMDTSLGHFNTVIFRRVLSFGGCVPHCPLSFIFVSCWLSLIPPHSAWTLSGAERVPSLDSCSASAPVNGRLSGNLSSCVNVSSLSFSKVPRGDRGGPVVHPHRWTIPSAPSQPSSFSICSWGPARASQCPRHPCCLLTSTSLPARWHAAWWPVLFVFWRLWKGGWVWTWTTFQLQEAFVSVCSALLANESVVILRER